jgi:hypothetical protein
MKQRLKIQSVSSVFIRGKNPPSFVLFVSFVFNSCPQANRPVTNA